MLNHRMCSRTACGLALVSILACQALSADACKKDCGVIVAGQPKLWSLSDALYLVGDARERLRNLSATLPGETAGPGDVDPNEVHLRQLNLLLQTLGINVQYDQAQAVKNQDAQNQYQQQVKQYQSDQAARAQLNQQLQTQQDQLAKANNDLTAAKADQARLDALVAGAEAEQTRLQTPQTALQNEQVTAGSPEAAQRDADLGTVNAGLADVGKRLDGLYKSQTDAKAKVAQLTQTQAGAQQAVTDTQTRLSAITTQYPQAPSVTGTGPVSADKIAAGPDLLSDFFTNDSVKTAILQQMNKILAQDPKAPYLQTIRSSIDGYLQTIAQRLTLLRESADPNYDLYFMEVSASVEPSKQAKNHMARARWVFQESQIDWKGLANDLLNQRPDNDATRQSQMATLEAANVKTPADRLAAARKAVQELTAGANGTETGTSLSVLEEAKPYAFELSPAQGAVNVALSDVHDSRLSIVGIFSTLIGIGGGFNYQREHQIYGQFLEQNVYLAAQGKGSNVEFGWDYGPVPGASYTASGTFTTYGVLAVPKYTLQLKFNTKGDWMLKPEKGGTAVPVSEQSNASCYSQAPVNGADQAPPTSCPQNQKSYKLSLPGANSWVSQLLYAPVPAGEEIAVIMTGRGFSAETSILVNDIPLEPRWRLIDSTSGNITYTKGATPQLETMGGKRQVIGSFEVTSQESITMRFRMEDTFTGIPEITVISPQKSIHLNELYLRINWDQTSKRVLLKDAEKNYRLGMSRDFIMFEPADGWQRVDATVLRVCDACVYGAAAPAPAPAPAAPAPAAGAPAAPGGPAATDTADIRLTVTGWTIDKDAEFFVVGNGSEEKVTADREGDSNKWILQGAKVTDGYVTYRIKQGEKTIVQNRVAVPLRPVISSLSSPGGALAGGDQITIAGRHLMNADSVYFGQSSATILARTDTALRVLVPKSDTETKAPVRVVSAIKDLDNRDLASIESDKLWAYSATPAKPAGSTKPLPLGDADDASWRPAPDGTVSASLTFTLPDGMSDPSVSVAKGSGWVTPDFQVVASSISLHNAPTAQAELRVRLSAKKDGATSTVYERIYPVPAPQVVSVMSPDTKGGPVILAGKNLGGVTQVRIGGVTLTPVVRNNTQLTVNGPNLGATAGDFQVFVMSPFGSAEGPVFHYRP